MHLVEGRYAVDAEYLEIAVDASCQAGQHAPRAELQRMGDAHLPHLDDRLDPANGAVHLPEKRVDHLRAGCLCAGIDVGHDRKTRRPNIGRGERLTKRLTRGRHECTVKRCAHVERNDFAPPLLGELDEPLHASRGPSDHRLRRGIEVGAAHDFQGRRGLRTDFRNLRTVQVHHRGHGSLSGGHRVLHRLAAHPTRPDGGCDIERTGGDQRTVFAERVARGALRIRQVETLAHRRDHGCACGHDGRLGVGSLRERLERPLEAQPRNRLAQRLVGLGKNRPGGGRDGMNVFAHTHLLGALTREQPRYLHSGARTTVRPRAAKKWPSTTQPGHGAPEIRRAIAYNAHMSVVHGFDRWRALAMSAVLGGVMLMFAAGCQDDLPESEDDGDRKSSERRSRTEDDDEQSDGDDRKVLKQLERWIRTGHEAMYVEGDAETYWALYAKDGRVINARSQQPDVYDYVVPATRARAFIKLRDKLGKAPPLDRYEQGYRNVTRSLAGDRALLQWDVHTSWKQDDGLHKAAFTERYTVARSGRKARWRISEKRTWTLSTTRPARENEVAAYPKGVHLNYDAAFWTQLDARVERARAAAPGANLFWALFEAGRHPEAHQLAKTFTTAANPSGEAYFLLAMAAARLSHGEETKASFAKARALDARLYPPRPWGPRAPATAKKRSPFTDWMRRTSAATL